MHPANNSFRIAQWGLLGSLLVLVAGASAAIAAHPAIITAEPGQAAVYLALFGLIVVVYGAVALIGTRASAAVVVARGSLRVGLVLGLACGAAWSVELVTANLIHPPDNALGRGLYLILYFGSSASAFLLPGLAGFLAARQAGRAGAGLRAGLLCGLCGGLIIFLAWLAFSSVFIPVGRLDPQTVQEFQRSGLPDLTTYIVSDYLAGMIAHLWIGLINGLVLGGLGSLIGQRVSRIHQG